MAVTVTMSPRLYVPPPLTVPAPEGRTRAVRAWVGWPLAKFAVTERSAVMLTEHAPVPVQAPPQPVNR